MKFISLRMLSRMMAAPVNNRQRLAGEGLLSLQTTKAAGLAHHFGQFRIRARWRAGVVADLLCHRNFAGAAFGFRHAEQIGSWRS